jgi:hypothetical protein
MLVAIPHVEHTIHPSTKKYIAVLLYPPPTSPGSTHQLTWDESCPYAVNALIAVDPYPPASRIHIAKGLHHGCTHSHLAGCQRFASAMATDTVQPASPADKQEQSPSPAIKSPAKVAKTPNNKGDVVSDAIAGSLLHKLPMCRDLIALAHVLLAHAESILPCASASTL